ncbi:heparin lyase I family protein [Caballeronia ptereochthonis]|uniref:Polysaccharide lyase-like protein n=1 Tax=Caballeronia ptereochthonis TaxID=1777144 RepID=A0A158BRY3_9BURK|nr:heparin lyase I family protein [Caballeronia ptereochthonis]SAK72844.1 hypothetical protein AWB83_03571 [Caballeronia ptereochthonis]
MNPFRHLVALLRSRPVLVAWRRCTVTTAILGSGALCAQNQQVLYQTNWQDGLDPHFGVQANSGDIAIVADPAGEYTKALQTTIRLSEDFSHVANGVPRAELLFPSPVRFAQSQTYRVRWSTMLPPGTQFDARQFVIITQINQGTWLGGPTLALALQGKRYAISQRGGGRHDTVSAGKWLCCADADVGKWVHWELIYGPQESGKNAVTELRRDGKQVFLAQDVPNAYPGVQNAYLKIGLYKPDWQKEATDVAQVSLLYGPVTVSRE